ncbi:MAG: hypothetical protein U0599_15940 [Vicinamibacteria bacterium]
MKQFAVSIGESTWMIPMTSSLFHSGAHTAADAVESIESPAPKRGSTIASDVRIETRSCTTRSAIVFDTVIRPSPPPAAVVVDDHRHELRPPARPRSA